ncbi:MAG: cobalt transport protein [Oscillospiraceae bacterium]|nr:cobalt transport protein [Oscillospiraceae bacterium]
MKTLDNSNPIAAAVYFICAAGVAMFSRDPIIIALSLAGAVTLCILQKGGGHLFFAALFVLGTAVNPLFNHRGSRVLFVLNNNPVTAEALLYGALSSAMVVAAIYWFKCFSTIMTSDKLLYIFGSAMPKLSLIISMALRYVPLFTRQAKTVSAAQKTMGIYKEENIIDSIRAKIRVFSVMVTWTLENGIITADSMEARGYSAGRRSFFAIYKFTSKDVFLLAASLLLAGAALLLTSVGDSAAVFEFFPTAAMLPPESWGVKIWAAYISYGILAMLPSALELEEVVRWKYLQSKI